MPRKKGLEEEKRTMNMRAVNIEFDCRNSILKMLQNYIVEKLQIYHWIANSLINV
jgi:lipopolysaccharide export system protein LptA